MNSTIRHAIRLAALLSLSLVATYTWAQGRPDFIPPPIDPTKDSPAWPGPGKTRKTKAPKKPAKKPPAKRVAAPQTGAKTAATPKGMRVAAGWSDRDTKEAVASLTARLLRAPWLAAFSKKHGRAPSIVVGRVRNRTNLHVNTREIERAITAALARSKRVRVAMPKGAGVFCPDLLLAGTLYAPIHRAGKSERRDFRLFLSLSHIVNAERVWIDDFSRRKLLRKVGGKTIVTRLAPKQRYDLSGELTDLDIQQTARAAIKHLLARPMARNSKKHVLRLYPIRNRTPERIGVGLIRDSLEREIVRSGRFTVVTPRDAAQALRALRARMVRQKGGACAVPLRHETPSTLLVNGRVSLRMDRLGGSTVKFYLLSFQAIDISSDRKLWLFTRPIQMMVKKSRKKKKSSPGP